MIDTEELRIKQAEFESIRQDSVKDFKNLEKIRQDFLTKFPLDKIKDITVEQYVVGGGNSKTSFCYILENKLEKLGNIHGSRADKFGIYFGKIKGDEQLKYRFVRKFGNNEKEAFSNVKKALIDLLSAAEIDDLVSVRDNILSPMFKGKILSTYYPEKFLNIYARDHIEYFLNILGIPYIANEDEVFKRQALMNFKNNDRVMAKWTVYEFAMFLYNKFGRPTKKEEVPEELREYVDHSREYPEISKVNGRFVELTISQRVADSQKEVSNNIGKKIDFEREQRIHKLLGDRGENVVFNLEKQNLKDNGKSDLANKVKWVSKESDSFGYDILSYEMNGEEKYIEVKATTRPATDSAYFNISINQYNKAKQLKNYYFYVVFEAKSTIPKVWPIKDPLQHENKGLTITPSNFKVNISICE